MLGNSRFLLGLLQETPAAVNSHIALWDQSTIFRTVWENAASRSKVARDVGTAFAQDVAKPIGDRFRSGLKNLRPETFGESEPSEFCAEHPLDLYIAKFCRLSNHVGLKAESTSSDIELHELGLEIERDAVRTLREVDTRSVAARWRGKARVGFEGTTIDDLVRHVIQQTFQALDKEFQTKSAAEKEAIAAQIARALRDLPKEEQERIQRAAGLPDLTAATLQQAGVLASIGFGVSGVVGIAGFSAYTTLVSAVAAVTGLVGIHLSFGTYMALTSGLAGLANPLFSIPMILGGGAWLTSKANKNIRSFLFPALVASSVLACENNVDRTGQVASLRRRLSQIAAEIERVKGVRGLELVKRFPGLGSPSLELRIGSHVAG